MPSYHFRSLFRLTAIFLTASLLSCSTTPPAPDGDRAQPDPSYERSAEQLFADGQFDLAAAQWQQQAINASESEAARLRVAAADAWLLAGQPENARSLLHWIDPTGLDPGDRSRLDLVLADLALQNQRFEEAGELLRHARAHLPPDAQVRLGALERQLENSLRQPGSQSISRAAGISKTILEYQPIPSLNVMKALEPVHSSELAARSSSPGGDRSLVGWLDLALVIRQNLVNPQELDNSIMAWKSRYPEHVLSETDALDLWLIYRQQFSRPSTVAILLPGSGRLQAAGKAIRDGLLSAYLEQPGGTELKFYPTGSDPQSAIAAYFQAVDEGAKLVIGPLQSESVEAVLGLAGLGTPLLALNRLPESLDIPGELSLQIHGLSLSQEEEASAVGRHVADIGLNRAIVIAPESSWGERMAQSFASGFIPVTEPMTQPGVEFESIRSAPVPASLKNTSAALSASATEGPEIIESVRYLLAENDHSRVLEQVLQIEQSKARKASVENILQIPLTFEPVRRDDIDVIFMAANASQARLLRPQLKFHDAGDIPVFATGRIYSGQPDRIRNSDLNGIRFPVSPWLLEHPESTDLPDLDSIREGNFAALFALGRDAWNVLPWLELMKADPDFKFDGNVGKLSIDSDNALQREPAWAIFARGFPVPWAPE
jgi:outer membrane PBP1 activator LpoA protein